MVADLSAYLPDPTAALEHGTLAGMKLMELATVGASFQAVVDASLSTYAAEWDFHELIRYDPDSSSRPICLEIMERGNDTRMIVRKVQQIANTTYYVLQGIFGFGVQDVVNATNIFSWELVSASGNTATLRRIEGGPDPNNITMSVFSLNPNWIPGENTRYTVSETQIKLPAESFMTVSAGSKLRYHSGWVVESVQAGSVAVGETFTVKLRTRIGPAAAEKHDSADTGTIAASFEFYVSGYRPDWSYIADEERMFCVQKESTINGPFESEIELESTKRIQWPDSNIYWFTATANTGADVTGLLLQRVNVVHDGASGFRSIIDIADIEEDLEDYDSITFDYWVESTDDAAKPCNGVRCRHMRRDYSGSTYDTTVSAGSERWNCMNGSGCDATPRKDCYDTTASGFGGLETPTHAGDQNIWKQILFESHFRQVQLLEGFTLFNIEAVGCPSLAHISSLYYTMPEGWHTKITAFLNGGMVPIDTSGDTVETLRAWRQDWDTLESHGPAGGNASRVKAIGTATEDDFVNESSIMTIDADIDPYQVSVVGKINRYQTVDRAIKLAVCNVDTALGSNFGVGASLVKQMYDADLAATSDPELAVYYGYLTIDRNLDIYNRQSQYNVHGGNKFSAEIAAVTDNEDGTFWIEFANGTITAGSNHPTIVQSELISQWKSGGTRVAAEDSQRVNNYLSFTRMRGPMADSMARVGDCIRLSDDTFAANVKNKRLWIIEAQAYAGGTDSWKPEDLISWVAGKALMPVIVFGNASEVVSSVTVTRNSGAVTFTTDQGFPFPLSIAKDTLVWDEFAGDGIKGFACRFSHLNMTTSDADRVVALTVATTIDGSPAGSYAFTDYNIMSGLQGTLYTPGGVDAPQCLFNVNMGSSTIESVKIFVDYPDPSTGALTTFELTDEIEPFPSSWSELGLSQWSKIVDTPQNWIIAIPAQYMGAGVQIQVTTDGLIVGDDDDYFNGLIVPHLASVRSDYQSFGRKRDRIKVRDELGIMPSEETLVGKTIRVTDDGVMHYSESGKVPVVKLRKADTTIVDLAETTNFAVHGADGRIYLKTPFDDDEAAITIESGDSFYIGAWVRDGRRMHPAKDTEAVRTTIERMVSE